MKLYNPFKQHIVQTVDGLYYVRRSRLFYWEYKDNGEISGSEDWWFLFEHAKKWCSVKTLEEAIALRDKKQKEQFKVIHG